MQNMARFQKSFDGTCPIAATLRTVTEKLCFRRLGTVLLFTLSACNSANSSEESLYTSVKSGDCRKPSTAISAFYESRGLTAEECVAAKGWRLFFVSSDERSWPELARDATLWSSEEQVVYKNNFGHFPNIGAEKVEWRMTKAGIPTALIFRIAAQDPQHTDKNLSRLFVLGFRDQTPYFCGVANTNQEARMLVEKRGACSTALQVRQLPK